MTESEPSAVVELVATVSVPPPTASWALDRSSSVEVNVPAVKPIWPPFVVVR